VVATLTPQLRPLISKNFYLHSLHLNARPSEGVRVRMHEVRGIYSALLQIESESAAQQNQVDEVCRGLLAKIHAENIKEIEPYD